jgi:hypothetical protein
MFCLFNLATVGSKFGWQLGHSATVYITMWLFVITVEWDGENDLDVISASWYRKDNTWTDSAQRLQSACAHCPPKMLPVDFRHDWLVHPSLTSREPGQWHSLVLATAKRLPRGLMEMGGWGHHNLVCFITSSVFLLFSLLHVTCSVLYLGCLKYISLLIYRVSLKQ